MSEGRFVCRLEMGAMTDVPIWEKHPRGKNWMAAIKNNPKAPGGVERKFFEKAHGNGYFYLVDGLSVGTPVEFGADYYTGGGNRVPRRWYGVVAEITEDTLVLDQYGTAREAVAAAEKRDSPDRRELLEREKERILARLKEIDAELADLQ